MTEEAKKRKRDYVARYQRMTYTNISFKLRTKEDRDIIVFLNNAKNKSELLKRLIKNEMEKTVR